MNERLKELCVEAGGVMFGELCGTLNFDVERFAELVRQDYIEEMNGHTLKMVMIAIAREREACAMLCEEWYLSGDVAKAIRSRN
jgi:hypothetical protein